MPRLVRLVQLPVVDCHSIAIANIRAILRANRRVIMHEASRLAQFLWCVCSYELIAEVCSIHTYA